MAAVDGRLATGASYDFVALVKVAHSIDEDLPGDAVRAYLDQQIAAGKIARIPVGEGMVRYQRRIGRPSR